MSLLINMSHYYLYMTINLNLNPMHFVSEYKTQTFRLISAQACGRECQDLDASFKLSALDPNSSLWAKVQLHFFWSDLTSGPIQSLMKPWPNETLLGYSCACISNKL